jgi:hypothetical protein
MSVFFEGNGYFDGSYLVNSSIGNNYIGTSTIKASTIDMLSTSGNYTNITSVKDPVNPQDAATKNYVDILGIVITQNTLSGTQGTLISNLQTGSFVVTVTNLVMNGPSAVFNITKNIPGNCGQVMRTVAAPGIGNTVLDMYWLANGGVYLVKSSRFCDGSYQVKLM